MRSEVSLCVPSPEVLLGVGPGAGSIRTDSLTCGCSWDPVVLNVCSPQTSLLFFWGLLGLEGGVLALKPGLGARMPGITWNLAWGVGTYLPSLPRPFPGGGSRVLSADGCRSALRIGLPIPLLAWLTLLVLTCWEEVGNFW